MILLMFKKKKDVGQSEGVSISFHGEAERDNLQKSCIKNSADPRTTHHTCIDDMLSKLDTAGMLLSSFFRELLVLCISTKGFSHNCIKIFCSMKTKGVIHDIMFSYSPSVV